MVDGPWQSRVAFECRVLYSLLAPRNLMELNLRGPLQLCALAVKVQSIFLIQTLSIDPEDISRNGAMTQCWPKEI